MGRPEKAARTLGAIKRRGIALLGLAMIVAGGIWAAVAMAATSVQVDGLKGNTSVEIKEENADVKGVLYNIDGERKRVTGYSLLKVLNQAGIGDEGWTRVFIVTTGGTIVIREGEVFSGERLPVFALPKSGDDVYFIRPKKGDAEAVTGRANTLNMNYRVPVDIDPSDLGEVETGDTVKFRVNAPGPESQYGFKWRAGSSTGTGATFEYTFPSTGGRVEINVEASSGGDIVAEQTIATPVKEPPPENDGSGTGGIGTGSNYGTDYGGYDSGYTPSTDYGGDFGELGQPNPEPNFPETPEETPEDATLPEVSSGTSVSGELLAAVAPLEPSSGGDGGETSASQDEATPPEDQVTFEKNEEVTAPGALIAAGVVVGLIGLGAGREIEDVRPRRFLRRPDFSGLRRLLPPWK